MEKVSVIIPTYNREKTIGRAISSVINQTHSNFEIIVIDDHSTDSTLGIVKAFSDTRIRYYYNEQNIGANKSRNKGISKAEGELIAFLDSDDEWRSDKLEKQISYLKKNNADICICKMLRHGFPKGYPRIVPDLPEGMIDYKTIISCFAVATPTIMAKREVFDEFRFDESLKRWQDFDWSIRACRKYKICFWNEVLVDAYSQSDGITQFDRNSLIDINIALQDKYRENYDIYPGLKERLLNELIKDKSLMGVRCDEEVSELLKIRFSGKYVIKYLLNCFNLLPLFYYIVHGFKRKCYINK